jgi:hypothetical protein
LGYTYFLEAMERRLFGRSDMNDHPCFDVMSRDFDAYRGKEYLKCVRAEDKSGTISFMLYTDDNGLWHFYNKDAYLSSVKSAVDYLSGECQLSHPALWIVYNPLHANLRDFGGMCRPFWAFGKGEISTPRRIPELDIAAIVGEPLFAYISQCVCVENTPASVVVASRDPAESDTVSMDCDGSCDPLYTQPMPESSTSHTQVSHDHECLSVTKDDTDMISQSPVLAGCT